MLLKGIRTMVALALALSVPLQGIAMVTAGLCSAVGHHDVREGAAHSHELHHAHSAAGQKHSHSHHSSQGEHCAPCVGCCAAVAISSHAPQFVPEGHAVSAIA